MIELNDDMIEVLFQKGQEDPKLRQKVAESLDLHGLQEHPGWAVLKEHQERTRGSYMKNITAQLIAGKTLDQREIDYLRGAFDVAEKILQYPEVALANLERVAARLYRTHLDEEVERLSEDSPYLSHDEEPHKEGE